MHQMAEAIGLILTEKGYFKEEKTPETGFWL